MIVIILRLNLKTSDKHLYTFQILSAEQRSEETNERNINQAYEMAKERYASLGVDTEKAMDQLQQIALSLHCWQTDDVMGFENQGGSLTGGIQVTGNYPGRARTIDEVRSDIIKATSLIPGKHRLNLHAIYGDFQGKVVDRDEIEPMSDFHFSDEKTKYC